MNIENFIGYVREKINDHPDLKMEILDLYWLTINEIDEGGSERHEIDLAINSIEELINEGQ